MAMGLDGLSLLFQLDP